MAGRAVPRAPSGHTRSRSGKEALAALANVYRDYAREHPGRYDAGRLRLGPETAEGRLGFRATGDPAETAAGKLTLSVIREELARIVAQRAADDPHLHLLDGRELYGEDDFAELPLPDGLHPDAATYRRMGERFAAPAFGPQGAFAAVPDGSVPDGSVTDGAVRR